MSKSDNVQNEKSFVDLYLKEYNKITDKLQTTDNSDIKKYFRNICHYDSVYYMLSLKSDERNKEQEVEISLDDKAIIEFSGLGIDITPTYNFLAPFTTEPMEKVFLPAVQAAEKYYLSILSGLGDKIATILIIPDEAGQYLYIDSNDDEDLTNDGEPLFYPNSDDRISFSIHSNKDCVFRPKPATQSVESCHPFRLKTTTCSG